MQVRDPAAAYQRLSTRGRLTLHRHHEEEHEHTLGAAPHRHEGSAQWMRDPTTGAISIRVWRKV